MFSFEEYKTMLELQCQTSEASELNSHLIELHALFEGWEGTTM